MAQYNEVTRRVCEQDHVEIIDLAGNLKANLSLLYDDCHFNVAGAEQVAQLVVAHLLRTSPLGSASAY